MMELILVKANRFGEFWALTVCMGVPRFQNISLCAVDVHASTQSKHPFNKNALAVHVNSFSLHLTAERLLSYVPKAQY